MFITGLIAAAGMIFLLLKFKLSRIVHFNILVDIIITFFFIWIFAGTFAGMMAGLMGGVIISAFLYIAKFFVPREKLTVERQSRFPFIAIKWVRY